MKIALAIAALCYFVAFMFSADAAEKVLVFNDQEQAYLARVLDLATKAGDTKDARITVYFLNKLESAPVKTDPPPATEEAPK